jgi:ribosomal protein S8E
MRKEDGRMRNDRRRKDEEGGWKDEEQRKRRRETRDSAPSFPPLSSVLYLLSFVT